MRDYFRKGRQAKALKAALAAQPPEAPPPQSDAWKQQFVVGYLPSGAPRWYDTKKLRASLRASATMKRLHAEGRISTVLDSQRARKLANKRWKRHAKMRWSGVRKGVRLKNPQVCNRAEIRATHATREGDWRIYYDANATQWWVRDLLGERRVSERAALCYGGYYRWQKRKVPLVPTRLRDIDLVKEGWNV